jgi:hypothetical protein
VRPTAAHPGHAGGHLNRFDSPTIPRQAVVVAVTGGKASFVAKSTTASAAHFGREIGVQATQTWEMDDPGQRPGSNRDHAAWIVDRDLEVEGESLDAGLHQLLAVFHGHEAEIQALSAAYDMYVQCYASSDSTQGGFILGPAVMRRMGELGLDLLCTVYIDGGTSEQS